MPVACSMYLNLTRMAMKASRIQRLPLTFFNGLLKFMQCHLTLLSIQIVFFPSFCFVFLQATQSCCVSSKVDEVDVALVLSARHLGVWFDSRMDMFTHISKTCGSAFYFLYTIRHKYLSTEHAEQLIHAFIRSPLDYCNSLLYGAGFGMSDKETATRNERLC